jgi:predicted enzyme related to lactoylglutathione lyase
MARVPITEVSSGEIFPGELIWQDLLTPGPLLPGKFYAALFGGKVEYRGHYAVCIMVTNVLRASLQANAPDDRPGDGVWIPAVFVADMDAAARLVKANGGQMRQTLFCLPPEKAIRPTPGQRSTIGCGTKSGVSMRTTP